MKLARPQYYLRLQSVPDSESDAFSLRITSDLKGILREWDASTRISPVWKLKPPVENAPPSEQACDAEILFIAATPEWLVTQLSPNSMALLGDDSIWLTLGVYSLVITSCFDSVSAELKELCQRHLKPHEIWYTTEPPECGDDYEQFNGDRIVAENPADYTHAAKAYKTRESKLLFESASVEADDTLGLMALEFYALLAVIETRAVGPFQALVADCLSVDHAANALITQELKGEPDKELVNAPLAQGALLTLNAALSRMSSQALAGTSPILRTESHFWPHSMLGIGVASLALRNLASFVTGLIVESKYDPRYDLLLQRPSSVTTEDIELRSTDHPLYLQLKSSAIHKFPSHSAILEAAIPIPEDDRYLITAPVTYFSGRDGFRNDAMTVSAPLSSVSGCNSYQWNLGTITHELSHRILSGRIQDLLNGWLDRMEETPSGDPDTLPYFRLEPKTIREHAENLLGVTLMILHIPDYEQDQYRSHLSEPAEFYASAKRRHGTDIEETLVHIFDYYHFYSADPKTYVDFVWLSWAIQPTIAAKFDEYIKRTLTALAVRHFASDNWRELAIADFKAVLEQEPLASCGALQAELLKLITDPSAISRYDYHLERMQYLLTLFHLLLKSDGLRDLAYGEAYSKPKSGQERTGERRKFRYAATAGTFYNPDVKTPPSRFSNPLQFLRSYSRQAKPNAADSAWLLHMLAFNQVQEITSQDAGS